MAAGVKRGSAVRSANCDEDAGFANFQAAEAVRNGYAVDRELGVNFGRNLTHFGERHRFVGFIVQVQSAATMGLIANAPVEGDDGAVRARANTLNKRVRVDGFVDKQNKVAAGRGGHPLASAAAYRREKGDFVAGIEWRAPRREFLVARSNQRTAIPCKLRETGYECGKQILDTGAGCEFDKLLRCASRFLEPAKEEDLDPNGRFYAGRRHAAHKRIVTRRLARG